MNCQEFEQLVAELVADRLMSARTRVAALAHAAACQFCGDKMAAELDLNQRLLGLANSTGVEHAPVRLRQSLRAEFEAQAGHVRTAAESSVPQAIRTVARTSFFNWQWSWGMAAATTAIVILVVVSVWRSQQASTNERIVAGLPPMPTMTPMLMPSLEVVLPQNKVVTNGEVRKQFGETLKDKKLPQRSRQLVQTEENLATHYISLNYAAGSVTPEESVVVRVDVPRTTLIAMGLPLNLEYGSAMVKADLRVGIDGVPLAIRLVRQ